MTTFDYTTRYLLSWYKQDIDGNPEFKGEEEFTLIELLDYRPELEGYLVQEDPILPMTIMRSPGRFEIIDIAF